MKEIDEKRNEIELLKKKLTEKTYKYFCFTYLFVFIFSGCIVCCVYIDVCLSVCACNTGNINFCQ